MTNVKGISGQGFNKLMILLILLSNDFLLKRYTAGAITRALGDVSVMNPFMDWIYNQLTHLRINESLQMVKDVGMKLIASNFVHYCVSFW